MLDMSSHAKTFERRSRIDTSRLALRARVSHILLIRFASVHAVGCNGRDVRTAEHDSSLLVVNDHKSVP
jgi:hypothetical protein